MISSNATDAQVAFHEAGHCVVAYLTGIYLLEGVNHTAGANAAHAGFELDENCMHARAHDNLSLTEDDYKRERAVVLAAGSSAERRYLELQSLPVDERQISMGAHGDLQGVVDLLGSGHWESATAAAKRLMDEVGVWDAVTKLANAIRRKGGKLSGDQVTRVVEDALLESNTPSVRVLRF